MAAKSQRVIIKVGHTQILLPDDTGAAQVVKTLSRGIVVWHYSKSMQVRNEELEVSLSYLPASTKFEDENEQPIEPVTDKRKLLPAKSGVLELGWKGED